MINRKRLITLTQKLVQIDSQNPPGNELEMVRFIREYLDSFGLKSKIYEFAKNRPNIICRLESDNPYAKTILISPHLDTVPAGRGWKYPPLKGIIKGDKIYGGDN